MGVETSQQIEFVPAVFKIIEHQRVRVCLQGMSRKRRDCSEAATAD
jgi:hypothetical protein